MSPNWLMNKSIVNQCIRGEEDGSGFFIGNFKIFLSGRSGQHYIEFLRFPLRWLL